MRQTDDLSKSLMPFVQGNTLIAVIELSLSSWLVAGIVPGVARQPFSEEARAGRSRTPAPPVTVAGRSGEERMQNRARCRGV